jgi:hypothetical protein
MIGIYSLETRQAKFSSSVLLHWRDKRLSARNLPHREGSYLSWSKEVY